MDNQNGLLTIIHLARKVFNPKFDNHIDKLVFSVICYFYGKCFRLVAFGEGCDNSENTEEIEQINDWNINKTIYQFKFLDKNGKVILMKCLMMGEDKLLVSWVLGVGGDSLTSVELQVSKFVGEDDKDILKNVEQFISIMSQNDKKQQQQQGSATPQYNPVENQRQNVPPRFLTGVGSSNPNPIDPLMVGRDDLNPIGGIEKDMFPGGNQVGPTHPLFRRKFGENETGGLREGPEMIPPGGRFNFIGPPGMQGSHPGDYAMGQQRRRRDMDDIGPPKGDFPDHMFM